MQLQHVSSLTRGVTKVATSARPRQVVVRSSNGGASSSKTTIHKLIEENGALLVPGCYDALSGEVLADAGHKAAFVSGYAVSATLLGEPDLGLMTPPEMARKAGQICYSIPGVPVLVDADTGGGNVLNVQRTIKQLIAVGCKGAFLEDQVWPKKSGHVRNKEVISMEEFASKVSAAREAIGDADFFLVARTDARGTSARYGLQDAITRANLYADAGADATFVEGPASRQELSLIGSKTRGLRAVSCIEGALSPLLTPGEAQALGFSIVVYPLAGLYAATRALTQVYRTLAAAGTSRDSLDSLCDFQEFNRIVRLEERLAAEERLLQRAAGDKLSVRVRSNVLPSP